MTGYQSACKQKQTMKSNLHRNMKQLIHIIMIRGCLQWIYFLRAQKIKPAVAYCCMDLVVCQRAENSQKLCEICQYTRRHDNHVEG